MRFPVAPLKHLAALPISNGVGEAAEFDDPTWPRYVRTTDIDGSRRLRDDTFRSLPPEVAQKAPLKAGDLVMTAAGGVGKSLLYGGAAPACYAGYLVRFRPRSGIDGRFVAYWAESQHYWDQVELGKVVSTIDNFSAGKYQNLRCPAPAEEVQRTIADYLDTETARIDALIEKKQLLTGLIRERRLQLESRLVSAAVGAARLPIASLFRISKGIDAQRLTIEYCHEHHGEYPVFSGQTSGVFGSIDTFDFSAPSGAIVVSTVGARVMSMTTVSGKFSLSQNCLVMIPHRPSEIVVESFVPQLKRLFDQLRSRIPDHMQPSLRVDDLKGKWLLVPSHSEQVQLASEIARLGRESNEICRRLEKQIELLVEHRQALITSAVTGELQVPGVAA